MILRPARADALDPETIRDLASTVSSMKSVG